MSITGVDESTTATQRRDTLQAIKDYRSTFDASLADATRAVGRLSD